MSRNFWENAIELPNGCLEWQGRTKDGHGIFWHDGRYRPADRVAWQLSGHGDCERLRHVCGNGLCVRHLARPITPPPPQYGAANGRSRFTPEQACGIFNSVTPNRTLARSLGVDEKAIRKIRKGQSWTILAAR